MAEYDITILRAVTVRETFILQVKDGEPSPTFPELTERIKTHEFDDDIYERQELAQVVQIEDATLRDEYEYEEEA